MGAIGWPIRQLFFNENGLVEGRMLDFGLHLFLGDLTSALAFGRSQAFGQVLF